MKIDEYRDEYDDDPSFSDEYEGYGEEYNRSLDLLDDEPNSFDEDEVFYDENGNPITDDLEGVSNITADENGEYVGSNRLLLPRRVMTKPELIALMQDFHTGDRTKKTECYEIMCQVLSPYTTHILHNFYPTYFIKHEEDMRQLCFLGIMEGMEGFDPTKGAPTTWFSRFMKHEIQLYINGLRGSTSHFEMSRKKLAKATAIFRASGKEPDNADLVIMTRVSEKTIKKINLTDKANNSVSLQANPVLANQIHDKQILPEEAYLIKERDEKLHQLIENGGRSNNRLTDEERDIIHCVYSFMDGQDHTLVDTAKKLGIKESRVKKLHTSALKKMRQMYRETTPAYNPEKDDISAGSVARLNEQEMESSTDFLLNDDGSDEMMVASPQK